MSFLFARELTFVLAFKVLRATSQGHLEYLVQWKGFTREEREWKMSAELTHAKEAVADFHRLHPAAPRPLTIKLRLRRFENFTTPNSVPRHLFNWGDGTFERTEFRDNRKGNDEEEWFDALEQQP